MPIDRLKVLQARSKAKAVLASDLSDEAKIAAKKVLDHANVALGLDDALARKRAREASTSTKP